MIIFRHRGNFNRTERFFNAALRREYLKIMQSYAKRGIEALSAATPKDTGATANQWYFETKLSRAGYSILWGNRNIVDGVPVVILLQYGHGNGRGGYTRGRDFINPAMKPIFDEISEGLAKELNLL